MTTPYVGKNARVQVAATNLYKSMWRVSERSTDIDTYNFESGGYGEQSMGKIQAEFTFSGYWDSAQNPHTDPPNLNPGQSITGVKLYLNTTDDVYWDIPNAEVISATTTAEADSTIKYEVTCKSHGSYTRPT